MLTQEEIDALNPLQRAQYYSMLFGGGMGTGGMGFSPFMTEDQRKQQAGILGAASAFDILAGRRAEREGQAQIEEGAEARQDVIDAIQAIKQRDFAGLTPEAERNAAIILKDRTPPTSAELSAAEMALRSGASPTKVQRALTESEQAREGAERLREEAAFREGMQHARVDEDAAIRKLMSDYGLDYQTAQEMINMGQSRSLIGQQQKGSGWQNAASAAMRYLMAGGKEDLAKKLGFKKKSDAEDETKDLETKEAEDTKEVEGLEYVGDKPNFARYIFEDPLVKDPSLFERDFRGWDEEDFLQNLGAAGFAGFEPGGVYADPSTYDVGGVMKTPGKFSHENNPIDVVRGGAKIAEMTGGEFVINPEQAAGMETAYAKAKRNPNKRNLMELFEAVRFIDEPQFD